MSALIKLLESVERPDLFSRPGRTDVANAQRFALEHRADVFYSGRNWFCWDGARFAVDDCCRIEALGKLTAMNLWREVADRNRAPSTQLATFLKSSCSASGVSNMVKLARSALAVPLKGLDADPMLLNCRNGTIDLRVGKLKSHRREDRITKVCPVDYDEDAKCKLWHEMLDRSFAKDQGLIAFVQRWLGYCLTGDVREQVLVVLHGDGANGKSTIVSTVLGVMGDYGLKAPRGLLLSKRGDSHPTLLASLAGKRAVFASETDNEALLDEAAVKDLTGGERQTARKMHQDYSEFIPTYKISLSTNYLPSIHGIDHAIWRRLLRVPFAIKIPEADQNKQLVDDLIAEWPGILAWMVEGCLEWQRKGLDLPQAVIAATEEYRNEEDIFNRWIDESCELGSEKIESATRLRESFIEFGGNSKMSAKAFNKLLAKRGFRSDKAKSGPYKNRVVYYGLVLADE
jgi:putative DNA primase/helicase